MLFCFWCSYLALSLGFFSLGAVTFLFLGFFFFFGAVTLLFFSWRGYLALVFRCWCRYLALSVCAVSLLFSNTSLQHSHTNGSEKNLLTPKSIRGNTLRGETQFRGVKV